MAIQSIKLPRFTNFASMIQNQPQLFERYWDDAMSQIEAAINAVLELPEIQEALVDLAAATEAAQDAADNANAAAGSITSETSLVNSFVVEDSFISPLIEADNLGNVTIAEHDRQYGDTTLDPTVTVDGDILATAAIPGDIVRIYYLDMLREGGAVTYQFTVDPAPPPVQGSGIHSVGTVTIPVAGTDDGNYIKPPGFVFD